MTTVIALPVYNKISIIESRINELTSLFPDETILIIDDNSSDGTSDAVKVNEKVKVITHASSLGYGGCVISALEFAETFDNIIFADIAEKNALKAIDEIKKALGDSDIVNLSRKKKKTEDNLEYHVFALNNSVSEKLNDVTNYNLADVFSPFKGIKISALSDMTLEEFDEALILQLWIQSASLNKKVCEIYLNEISNEDISDLNQLENDLDYYINFINGEVLLYPMKD